MNCIPSNNPHYQQRENLKLKSKAKKDIVDTLRTAWAASPHKKTSAVASRTLSFSILSLYEEFDEIFKDGKYQKISEGNITRYRTIVGFQCHGHENKKVMKYFYEFFTSKLNNRGIDDSFFVIQISDPITSMSPFKIDGKNVNYTTFTARFEYSTDSTNPNTNIDLSIDKNTGEIYTDDENFYTIIIP